MKKCEDCLNRNVCRIYAGLKSVADLSYDKRSIGEHANEYANRCTEYLVYEEGSLESQFEVNPHNNRRMIEIESTYQYADWLYERE